MVRLGAFVLCITWTLTWTLFSCNLRERALIFKLIHSVAGITSMHHHTRVLRSLRDSISISPPFAGRITISLSACQVRASAWGSHSLLMCVSVVLSDVLTGSKGDFFFLISIENLVVQTLF